MMDWMMMKMDDDACLKEVTIEEQKMSWAGIRNQNCQQTSKACSLYPQTMAKSFEEEIANGIRNHFTGLTDTGVSLSPDRKSVCFPKRLILIFE
jgi:hypothetical protein